jgi:hypothetical protein
MHQFMMAVMALAAFGAVVATAQAEFSGGAPIRNGDRVPHVFRAWGYTGRQ